MDKFEKYIHYNTGLSFFGKISASISHELKNSLAILNENSGLLSDMILMSGKGMPLNIERLGKLNSDIEKQIDRSNRIINNFNYFSHSSDEKISKISFPELATKYIALTDRLYMQKNIKVRMDRNSDDIILNTSEFGLLMLIWHIIEFLENYIEQDISVELGAISGENTGSLSLKVNPRDKIVFENIKNSSIIKLILEQLNAAIKIDDNIIIVNISDIQE